MTDRKKTLRGLECCRMNGKGCRQCPYNKECDEMPDFGNAYLCSDALELLKEQPEQKHGHWQNDKYGNMLCSVCGGLAIETIAGRIADWHLAPYLSNYCPQCGAKMDEEVKQDD